MKRMRKKRRRRRRRSRRRIARYEEEIWVEDKRACNHEEQRRGRVNVRWMRLTMWRK